MANLNFQQPPRIPSASLNRNAASTFGNSNSISGNVTPTSSLMFQSQQQQQAVNNSQFSVTGGAGGAGVQQSQQQQPNLQLSPNRAGLAAIGGQLAIGGGGGQMGANRRMYGSSALQQQQQQRDDFSSRQMPGGLGAGSMTMGSFMSSARYRSQSNASGGINNFFSNSSETPPFLDMSEFPSLTNARQNDQHAGGGGGGGGGGMQAPGSKPYVGMVKQPTAEQTEFQMSSEDFPALPGTSDNLAGVVGSNSNSVGGGIGNSSSSLHQTSSASVSSVISSNNNAIGSSVGGGGHHPHHISLSGVMNADGTSMMDNKNSIGSNLCMDMMQSETGLGHQQGGNAGSALGLHHMPSEKAKRGVLTMPNGLVTNIPPTMVNNQFGMIGLLTFIRAAESDPNLVSLAMGQDLTALGLNLNSMENLYQSFGGPFSEGPARPQDIDYPVPNEYLINVNIREKLSPINKMKHYKDDLLFFLFYTNCGDVMQLMAAAELYQREWRYHIEEKVWIMRVPGNNNYDKNGTIERGTYYYFDAQNWRRVPKEFQLDAQKLDPKPPIQMQ